jgi:hypothetical protein
LDHAGDLVEAAAPFIAGSQSIQQSEANCESDRDIEQTDQDEPAAAPGRNTHAQKCVQDCEQNQRHGQSFEEANDEQTELAQVFVANASHNWAGFENHSQRDACEHAEQHTNIQRQPKSSPVFACVGRRGGLIHLSARILIRARPTRL